MLVIEMTNNQQQIPAIRFNGFTDTWEQRKLEELAESFNYGLNASAMEFDGENKYIRITDIDEQSHKFIQSGLTSPNTDLLNADDYLLKEGDILFARTGASVGKSYQYEPLDGKVYYAGFLIRARIKPEFDPRFIFQNTLTEKYNNFIKVTSQRSGQPGVNAQEYANFSILIPSRGEQVKLGNFFKQLDDTIALHQRQLDNYKALKKAILQKIFNQELRFKDEKGNEYPKWMRKTVNDIGDVVTGTTPSTKEKAYYNNGIYPWVTPTDIIQKNIDSTPRKLTEQGLSKGRMLPENTILVTCIASIGKNAILKQKGSCNQQINAIVCNKNHNYEFVYYLMEKNTDVLKSLAGKGTMDIVNKDVFSKMQVTVPCLEEQLRIGKFLSELDGKIEDEHKIVNLMKKEKQGLMQQMFV